MLKCRRENSGGNRENGRRPGTRLARPRIAEPLPAQRSVGTRRPRTGLDAAGSRHCVAHALFLYARRLVRDRRPVHRPAEDALAEPPVPGFHPRRLRHHCSDGAPPDERRSGERRGAPADHAGRRREPAAAETHRDYRRRDRSAVRPGPADHALVRGNLGLLGPDPGGPARRRDPDCGARCRATRRPPARERGARAPARARPCKSRRTFPVHRRTAAGEPGRRRRAGPYPPHQ